MPDSNPRSEPDLPPRPAPADSADPFGDDSFQKVYDRLRELASGYLGREHDAGVLDPTELVNEACLRLLPGLDLEDATNNRVIGYAARVMRQVLVDRARNHKALKRGGDRVREHITLRGVAADENRSIPLDSLGTALERLAERDPQLAEHTDLHYFAGMTAAQIAAQRGVSRATVNRELSLARALLLAEIDRLEADRT